MRTTLTSMSIGSGLTPEDERKSSMSMVWIVTFLFFNARLSAGHTAGSSMMSVRLKTRNPPFARSIDPARIIVRSVRYSPAPRDAVDASEEVPVARGGFDDDGNVFGPRVVDDDVDLELEKIFLFLGLFLLLAGGVLELVDVVETKIAELLEVGVDLLLAEFLLGLPDTGVDDGADDLLLEPGHLIGELAIDLAGDLEKRFHLFRPGSRGPS